MTNIIVNISPPKCGTTALYFGLVASADVTGSSLKEPRFFSGNAKGDESGLPDAMRTSGKYDNGMKWHDALFDSTKKDARYRIDFTTYYAVTEDTPELLKRHYPDAKLIFAMRDPVARYMSHYYQYIKVGIRVPSIRDVVLGDNQTADLLYRFSDYEGIYRRYADVFGEEAIKLLDFRDLTRNYDKVSTECNAFLGLDDIAYAPSEREKNVAGRPRFGMVQSLMFSDAARKLTRRIPPGLKTSMLKLRKKVILANVKPEQYPELDDALREELTRRLQSQIEFYEKAF